MLDILLSSVAEMEKKDQKLSESYKDFKEKYSRFENDYIKREDNNNKENLFGISYKMGK
jgi:hypothetical protein